jgi:hypothetical protein
MKRDRERVCVCVSAYACASLCVCVLVFVRERERKSDVDWLVHFGMDRGCGVYACMCPYNVASYSPLSLSLSHSLFYHSRGRCGPQVVATVPLPLPLACWAWGAGRLLLGLSNGAWMTSSTDMRTGALGALVPWEEGETAGRGLAVWMAVVRRAGSDDDSAPMVRLIVERERERRAHIVSAVGWEGV